MNLAFLTTIGIALGLLPSFSSAQDLESRISNLEVRMSSVSTQTALGSKGAKMASASPQIDSYGLFITADFLFWNLNEGGMEYVLTDKETPGDIPFKGRAKEIELEWDPGFRIGAGYIFEHDAWDSCLIFTWFQTDGDSHAHAPSNGALIPLWGFPFTNEASSAKAHLSFDFYTLDLQLGRRYFVSKYLSIRPEFGVKTAWINQHARGCFKASFLGNPVELKIKRKNDFWGIGPQTGLDTTWFFGKHFSLFGQTSASLLWGDFDVHEKEKGVFSSGTIIDYKADLHAIVPTAQLLLGLQWETNFNSNRNHFKILAAYEFQYWWRQNQMLEFEEPDSLNPDRYSEDVSLQGLTLDLRFDF